MNIPRDVKDLLENNKLCTMATSWEDKPYLSLMNFTYLEAENKVILSSRKNSKKCYNIEKNENISLLVFSNSKKLSATFLGTAEIMTMEEKKDQYYRELHENNINMPQFVLGDNIALIVFSIKKIVISDNKDQVKHIN